jgi:hypothetical protein
MKQAREYKRLPGRYRSSTGQRTLWLGADHLLAVDRIYFEERYRRFYFSDIQALIVQSTIRWHVTTLILIVLTLTLLTPGWFFWQKDEYEIAFIAILPAIFLFIVLVVNLIKGKSCRCLIQMKVGVHDLPSIRRVRQAGKILKRINPLVQTAQKGLQVSDQTIPVATKTVGKKKVEPLQTYSGRWHLSLYIVLIGDLVGSVWHFLSPGKVLFIGNIFLGIAVLLLSIAGLVAQFNTRLPDSLRVSTWTIFGTSIAFMIVGYFYVMFFFMMKDPALLADQSRHFEVLSSLQLLEHPFLATITAIYVVVGLFCSVVGLFGVIRMKQNLSSTASL